jgi:hypothetical protein
VSRQRCIGFRGAVLTSFAELLGVTSRLCSILLLTTLAFAVPNYAQAAEANVRKGPVNVVLPQFPHLSSAGRGETFNGCGRGRVRDPKTNQCRGPADISRQPQSYILFRDPYVVREAELRA